MNECLTLAIGGAQESESSLTKENKASGSAIG